MLNCANSLAALGWGEPLTIALGDGTAIVPSGETIVRHVRRRLAVVVDPRIGRLGGDHRSPRLTMSYTCS